AVDHEERPADPASAARARAMLTVLREDAELVKPLMQVVEEELKQGRRRNSDTGRVLAALAARTHQLAAAEALYRNCLETVTSQTEAEVYSGLLDVLSEANKPEEIIK